MGNATTLRRISAEEDPDQDFHELVWLVELPVVDRTCWPSARVLWCVQMFGNPGWKWNWQDSSSQFVFRDYDDAALFLLTWL